MRPARLHIGLGAGIGCGRLFELLPGAGFGLRQRLLPLLLLTGFDLLRHRRHLLRFGLRDGGVLQFDLVGEIVERGLRADDAGLGLRDLGLVVGGIDLDQQIAGLDALEIVDGDGENLACDPAAQLCQLGPYIGVVGGLDRGAADPGIPAQRRQHDEPERGQHGEQRDDEAAPRNLPRSGAAADGAAGADAERRRGCCRSGWRGRRRSRLAATGTI